MAGGGGGVYQFWVGSSLNASYRVLSKKLISYSFSAIRKESSQEVLTGPQPCMRQSGAMARRPRAWLQGEWCRGRGRAGACRLGEED